MKTVRQFAFVLLTLLSTACLGEGDEQDIQRFWSEFRAAVMAGDSGKVAALTQFPFKTRGVVDSMPVLSHTPDDFQDVLPAMISTKLPKLDRQTLEVGETTMGEIIASKEVITEQDYNGENYVRVEDFVFERTDDGWCFTFAYWDDTEGTF